MKQILDPLAVVPGVRRVMLFSHEGVPIATVEAKGEKGGRDGESRTWSDSAEDSSAFAGLAAGWMSEVGRAIDPLSWSAPPRIVLEASRGTLILLVLERAILSVEIERGVAPEELRLSMEAAAARFHRLQRREEPVERSALESEHEPPGIRPGNERAPVSESGMNERTRNEVPEATRDS